MTASLVAPQRNPTMGDIAELVRLPAVLSVPGDVIAGATLAGNGRIPRKVAALAGASCLLYLGGMALNDVADHEIDAVERPHRPIPSGRVSRRQAALLGHALLAAGVMTAGFADRRSLRIAIPLAAAVYAYDLVLKETPGAPVAMATCRTLDVLLGGTVGRVRDALPAAATVGAHTLVVTAVSRQETTGGSARTAGAATAASAVVAGIAAATVHRTGRSGHRVAGLAPLAAHTALQVRDGLQAMANPSPAAIQRLVGTGVLGMVPLQSAVTISRGHRILGAALVTLWPLARRLARRRSVT